MNEKNIKHCILMESADKNTSSADASLHEERTSHEDDNYLSAGEDEDKSLHEDVASPDTSPRSAAEDSAPPPEEVVLVQPDHKESSFPPEEVLVQPEQSSFQTTTPPAEEVLAKDESSLSFESRAPPAEEVLAEKSPENEETAKESRELHSDKLDEPRETEEPPPTDSAVVAPENGDPVGNISSLAKSKSLNVAVANEKSEMKIVARPSTDDDVPAVPSPLHRRSVSVDLVAKVPANYGSSTPSPKPADSVQKFNNVQIDTAAPIKSVKAAVSKFGGIVDWKAHRMNTMERRKFIEQELEKAQEELPICKQQCEAANEARAQVLKQLESTKRLIEELKLNLERAQTEEQQAKQDSELAKLRVEEMEQGIADEASFAAKAQLEVAKARHAAAVSELKSVKDELEQLRTDYDLLIAEKAAAETKAEEAIFSSKEVEKSVESLTIELITLKQSLDSAHSAHLEAEEHRIGAVMAKEQDSLNWEVELKQAEEELEKLNQQVITTKELKLKLDEATKSLQDLKGELAAYMESKPHEETSDDPETETKTRADIEKAINAAKKELVDVKEKIEKATKEVNILKVASASLRSQLEKENMELEAVQEREGTASAAAASLEAELDRIRAEISVIQMKEQEEREKLVELPLQLQKAGQEAEQAKELVRVASEQVHKAKQEANIAKAEVSEREAKLRAVEREIEAAKASERLALAAITALRESESSQKNVDDDSSFGITLSLEEYYELSKRAHEAEEQANARVAAVMSQIEAAKESEKQTMEKLEEVSKEMALRKEALEAALQKSEEAAERKLSVEQELRDWRADHEQKRKNADSGHGSTDTGKSSKDSKSQKSPRSGRDDGKGGKKKKKSFFPRIFMFLGRSKKSTSSSSHSSKPEGS